MSRILGALSRWLIGRLGLLLLALVVLLGAAWLEGEWTRLQRAGADLPRLEQRLAELRTERADLSQRIEDAEAQWARRRERLQQGLEESLGDLDAAIDRTEGPWRIALARFTEVETQARSARQAADAAAVERDRLVREVAWWPWPLDLGRKAELAAARARLAVLEQQARSWELARDRVAPAIRNSPLQGLLDQRQRAQAEALALQQASAPGAAELERTRELRERDIELLQGSLEARRAELARDPVRRLLDGARAKLPAAFGIVLIATLLPVLLKAAMFFVIAPLAARLPPIRLLPVAGPGVNPPPVPHAQRSAVSLPVELGAEEELLLHPDFLQSSSEDAAKRTRWLLDPRMPFSSLASGMYLLTRIAPQPMIAAVPSSTRVVVSSRTDPYSEVGAITLPSGASMVIQPRALAGVRKPQSSPLRITRHWRLGSLHAWLTLQLRYLVFHGPCTLLLKGCRGVRAEQPDSGSPRVINQSATLGFSTPLEYRNTRCETFVPYLRGQEDLFNDVFSGAGGLFVYEELPAARRKAGITGRGLEGLFDVVLRPFGV